MMWFIYIWSIIYNTYRNFYVQDAHTRLSLFEENWNKVSLLNRMIWPSSEVINQNSITSSKWQMLSNASFVYKSTHGTYSQHCWHLLEVNLRVARFFTTWTHLLVVDFTIFICLIVHPQNTAHCVGKSLTACHQWRAVLVKQYRPTALTKWNQILMACIMRMNTSNLLII